MSKTRTDGLPQFQDVCLRELGSIKQAVVYSSIPLVKDDLGKIGAAEQIN